MASTKRALLIGSSFGDLPGTENDVNAMVSALKNHGFHMDNMKTLRGSNAPRQNILDAWQKLISDSSDGDSVVIYYSGHGGLAEWKGSDSVEQHAESEVEAPKRIQFLVPSDYDDRLEHWSGILDDEISRLLLDTTTKTPNVTYILDCCHSSRLGRDPQGFRAWPKALSTSTSDYNKVLEHRKQLKESNRLPEGDCWTNPGVVRIAAAADVESA
jgi:hypothetical protein